jgi:glyoxylase-like metal-dependent hydrolase (beta-lactamase superfamily II)
MVNVYNGLPGAGDDSRVRIDAGLYGPTRHSRRAAAKRLRSGERPAAIELTHDHFDPVGVLRERYVGRPAVADVDGAVAMRPRVGTSRRALGLAAGALILLGLVLRRSS